jgi:hypothetical protein
MMGTWHGRLLPCLLAPIAGAAATRLARIQYANGLSEGIRRGKQIIEDRFNDTGSISAHHPTRKMTASGKAIYTPEARKAIAEALRRKADEVSP